MPALTARPTREPCTNAEQCASLTPAIYVGDLLILRGLSAGGSQEWSRSRPRRGYTAEGRSAELPHRRRRRRAQAAELNLVGRGQGCVQAPPQDAPRDAALCRHIAAAGPAGAAELDLVSGPGAAR